MKHTALFAILVFFWFEQAIADDTPVPSKESSNYKKAEKFLPGEEVQTPTGQKMKVWSTEGPVKVNKAPEPFEDQHNSTADDEHIVIDATDVLERNQQGQGQGEDDKRMQKDSFDVRSR